MKQEDVGPVLVVSDHNEKRLTGIITDRDIAVKVVAEGRDPNNTRLEEVMSRNPVTCNENDDVAAVLEKMADHQVRRMPILDSNGRLVGIVSQADIARFADHDDVGELVEEISQPYGSGEWSGQRYSEYGAGINVPALATGAICFGLGAGLMFLLDPNQGRRRRHVLQDKAGSYARSSQWTLAKKSRDLKNRASGVVAAGKARLSSEPVNDEKLIDRIRSRMGRYVSHPHAVHASVHDGVVTLEGVIFGTEAERALKAVRSTPGVKNVEDRLERHSDETTHPSLQGGRFTAGIGGSDWGSGRLLMSAIGGGLVLYGLTARGAAAKTAATVGLGLVTSGLTNQDLQLGKLREMAGI